MARLRHCWGFRLLSCRIGESLSLLRIPFPWSLNSEPQYLRPKFDSLWTDVFFSNSQIDWLIQPGTAPRSGCSDQVAVDFYETKVRIFGSYHRLRFLNQLRSLCQRTCADLAPPKESLWELWWGYVAVWQSTLAIPPHRNQLKRRASERLISVWRGWWRSGDFRDVFWTLKIVQLFKWKYCCCDFESTSLQDSMTSCVSFSQNLL